MSSGLQLQVPDLEIMPNDKIGKYELICELRKTSTVLYGLFTELIRQFYMNGIGYLVGCPNVKWNIDPNKSDVWIDSELTWNDEHPEFRPAIFVHLDQLTIEPPPIGMNRPVHHNVVDAIKVYAEHVTGQVSFVHVAQRAGEAVMLCDNTMVYLNTFANQIQEDFCFEHFLPVSRTPLNQAQQESSERYASTITYKFTFYEDYEVKFESPKLKVLQLKTLTGKFDRHTPLENDSIGTHGKPPEL